MASLKKPTRSANWIACFQSPDGTRSQRTTKIPIKGGTAEQTRQNRKTAKNLADTWEKPYKKLQELSKRKMRAGQARRVLEDLIKKLPRSR